MTQQADNFLPPEYGGVIVLTANQASVKYDLFTIDFGFLAAGLVSNSEKSSFYITMMADGGDVGFVFSNSNSASINVSNASAAGTLAWTPGGCLKAKDGVIQPGFKWYPERHRYLYIHAASGSPLFRVFPSSQTGDGRFPKHG